MNWPNWWQWKNLHYKIYPYSCSNELINLSWYCWGGFLYPYRSIWCLSLSEILTTGLQPRALLFVQTWSDLLLNKYLVASKTNQFSLHYLYQLKRNLFFYFLVSKRIVDKWVEVNNWYYLQGNCVVKEFSTDMCWKDSIRRYWELPHLIEGEFQDQGQLDQDLEEWLSPRGSQSVHGFFSEEENQESIQTEDSAPEGARISNQAPEGETSTMVVVKWSYKVEWSGDDIDSPLYGGLYKEEEDSLVPWSGTDPDAKMNCFTWSK